MVKAIMIVSEKLITQVATEELTTEELMTEKLAINIAIKTLTTK